MEIATSVIAGCFALVAAYFAWKLRLSENNASLAIEKRREKEDLYKKIHRTFDGVIQAIKRHERTAFQSVFIELNAKVNLLASEELRNTYEETCQYLKERAALFPKAWPNTTLFKPLIRPPILKCLRELLSRNFMSNSRCLLNS